MDAAPPTSPLICGKWDGVNLWVQWDALAEGAEVGWFLEVALSLHLTDPITWEAKGGTAPLRQTWMVLPTFREGWWARARVRVAREGAEWVSAQEVTFARSRCLFEIASERRTVHYVPGTQFAAVVDGASCVYELGEEIEVRPGEAYEGEMQVAVGSGYCQLDHENHFLMRPSLGLTIRNLAPSVDDVEPTGQSWTQLTRMEERPPLVIVTP